MGFDLIIKNGTVVTASDIVRCDIGVCGGVITALGSNLADGVDIYDAEGLLVLPGGVDSHCHIAEPATGRAINPDSFLTASASAAAGGTTTVISFSPHIEKSLRASLADYQARARDSLIDYAFHIVVARVDDEILGEIIELASEGFRSIKVFMTYDGARLQDEDILKVLDAARRAGSIVAVHAENNPAIEYLTRALLDAGCITPLHHAWAKPIAVEREAVHRIIAYSELLDVPIQVFHVSGTEVAEEIERAQRRGLKVFGETCPHYLTLDETSLDQPGFEGAKFLCSPAIRKAGEQEALWKHLKWGTLGVISSDHAPTRYDDPKGKKVAGESAPFNVIPNGLPGLETRLPLVFSKGVSEGRIDLNKFVELTATNPAKLFGLYPRKGTIAVGSDADIAIWNPAQSYRIRNASLKHAVDYTPYEGMFVTGAVVSTFSRGELVFHQGEIVAKAGRGKLLLRHAYDFIKPSGRLVTSFDPVERRTVA